jgi:hypothetical protein
VDPTSANLYAGWSAMLGGAVSGAAVGVFFHRSDWLGGYASFQHRMIRLGHISFFGIGFINVLFAATAAQLAVPAAQLRLASALLIIAAVAMPALCFLTAWRERFRHLFALPVVAVVGAIVCILIRSD